MPDKCKQFRVYSRATTTRVESSKGLFRLMSKQNHGEIYIYIVLFIYVCVYLRVGKSHHCNHHHHHSSISLYTVIIFHFIGSYIYIRHCIIMFHKIPVFYIFIYFFFFFYDLKRNLKWHIAISFNEILYDKSLCIGFE